VWRASSNARAAGHQIPRLDWSELTDEKVASILLLARLRAADVAQ
jgi:hypothetical protein